MPPVEPIKRPKRITQLLTAGYKQVPHGPCLSSAQAKGVVWRYHCRTGMYGHRTWCATFVPAATIWGTRYFVYIKKRKVK